MAGGGHEELNRPKILVFASLPPVPVDRGDKNRLFHIVKLLSQFADIRIVCLNRVWEPPVEDLNPLDGIETILLMTGKRDVIWEGLKAMASLRPFVAFRFSRPRIVNAVLRQVDEFQPDIFWAYGIPAYPLLQRMKRRRRILDLVDSPSLYNVLSRRSAEMPLRARVQSFLQWRIQFYERLALQASHHVLVSSWRDRAHLLKMHGQRQNIHVLENCISRAFMSRQWQPQPDRPPKLLFVGNLAYPPNAAGVTYIARYILPRVQSRLSQTELIVCGRGGNRLAQKLAQQKGVRVVGYVEDLVSVYLESSVFVSPVPVVGGTQYKILEAMALGVPMVATRPSVEMSEMKPGRELLVGDSAEALASAVLRVLQNPDLAARLSDNARSFIRTHHIWEDKVDLLRSIVLNPEVTSPRV